MDQVTQQLQRDVAALLGTPLPPAQPCLRLSCKGVAAHPSPLCQWCTRTHAGYSGVGGVDSARRSNIGHRLGFSPGMWPSIDQLGGDLDVLEALNDEELRALAYSRGVPVPHDPTRKAALAEQTARRQADDERRREERTISRLKTQAAQIAEKLARF